MVNFIVGYLIIINLLAYIFIWLLSETDYIKLKDGIIDTIIIILTILGGFVGLLVASKLLNYKSDEKIFKKTIPFIIFVEVIIIIYAWYSISK